MLKCWSCANDFWCYMYIYLYLSIYLSIDLSSHMGMGHSRTHSRGPNGGWLIKTGQYSYSCSSSSYIFEYQHLLLQYLADLHWLVSVSYLYNPESPKSDTKQCAQDELWHQPCKPSTSAPSARRARARPLMLGCWAKMTRIIVDGQLKEAGMGLHEEMNNFLTSSFFCFFGWFSVLGADYGFTTQSTNIN